jgi:hypothetical protein
MAIHVLLSTSPTFWEDKKNKNDLSFRHFSTPKSTIPHPQQSP